MSNEAKIATYSESNDIITFDISPSEGSQGDFLLIKWRTRHLILNMKTTMWPENSQNYLHEPHTWQFEMISIGTPEAWAGILLPRLAPADIKFLIW